MISYVGGYKQGILGTVADVVVPLTSLSDGLDTAPSEGDVVVAYFSVGNNTSIAMAIDGYTVLADIRANDTYDVELLVAYKIMGATPDTSLTLVGGTKDARFAGAVVVKVYRGVDLTNPIDVTRTTSIQKKLINQENIKLINQLKERTYN